MLQPASATAPLFAGADQPARRGFGINEITVRRERVPVTTRDIAATPYYTLVEFSRQDTAVLPDILVVPPLSGHFAMLLRDLVIGFLDDFRVHVIDWTNVRHVPPRHGQFGLEDNIAAVGAAIRRLRPAPSVVGLCQGGVAALAATALLAADDSSDPQPALALIAAPIDPLANPTGVVRLIRARPIAWFADRATSHVPEPHAGHGRAVYPAQLQLMALLSYLARHLHEGGELLRKLRRDDGADPQRFPFLDAYTSIMDIDARHFVENMRRVFHVCALREGSLRCNGERVDLRAIRRTALVTIEGERDDIAAPGQTSAAHKLCAGLPTGLRRQIVVPNSGHLSLFHGSIFRREVLPAIRDVCMHRTELAMRRG